MKINQKLPPRIEPKADWRLISVKSLADYQLEVIFVDGTKGIVEMAGLILSEEAGVFATLKDIDIFKQVYLEHGVATWPDEIDLAPDAMYEAIKKEGVWTPK